jgi:hypothetical protein
MRRLVACVIVIAVCASGFGQQKRTLADWISVKFDPRNAYFDYMKVADILRFGNYQIYEQGLTPGWANQILQLAKEQRPDNQPAPEILQYARRFSKMTPLQIRREALEKFRDVFPIFEAARKKEVYDPRTGYNMNTLFPEYAYFKVVDRFLLNCAVEVAYADGQPAQAMEHYIDAFRLADTSACSPIYIGALVSKALISMNLSSLEKSLVRVSLRDCDRMTTYADEWLTRPDPFLRSAQGEQASSMDFIDDLFGAQSWLKQDQDSGSKTATSGKDDPVDIFALLAQKINTLSADKRAIYRQQTRDLLAKKSGDVIDSFKGKEKDWAAYLDSHSTPPPPQELDEQSPIPDLVVDSIMPMSDQLMSVALLERIQIRLMRATGYVMRYRWNYGRLPSRILDAGSLEVMTDPVTGQPFGYKVMGEGFELSAQGAKSMGKITLGYRRPPSSGSGGEAPPP